MAIVDPFDAPASGKGGIIDPFEQGGAATEQPRAWSDVPLEAAKNFLPDVGRQVSNLASMAVHNVKTAAPYLAEGPLGPFYAAKDIAKSVYNNPEIVKSFPKAVWNDLVEHYGSEDALKKTIATEPARFAMDVASVVSGGEAIAARVGRGVSEIGRAADVSRPFHDLPREPPAPPTPPPAPRSPDEAAIASINAAGVPLNMPSAITSPSQTVRSGAQALSTLPYVGTPLREAVQAVPGQLAKGLEGVAQTYSPKVPENIVGGGIQTALTDAAEGEAATARAAAEANHATRTKAWEAENAARVQAIEARQAEASNAAEQRFGNVNPVEAAQDTINDVQSAHRQARTQKDALYDRVNQLDARVHNSGFTDLRSRAEQALSDAGFTVDDPGSNASRMLDELSRLSGRPAELPAITPPPRMMQALQREYGGNVPASVLDELGFPGGVDAVPPDFRLTGAHGPVGDTLPVQGVDKLNQRIGRMGMDAEAPGDKAASRIIKGAFDDWRNDVLGSHLTADSEAGAGAVIDAARGAHRDLMERFGYNYKRLPEGEPRRAAKLLNQIVTEGVGPEALRDNLIGAKPGNRPVSAPLYEGIANAVPDPAALRTRMRGAYWNATGGGSPSAVARNVEGLTPTRMGSHLFDAGEHDLMRHVARVGAETPAQLAEAGRLASPKNAPKLETPELGRAGQLAKKMLGYSRSEEGIYKTLDSMMRTGGDIKNAGRTWSALPEASKNEFRGAFVRSLAGGGDEFNVAAFNKNWPAYSDQAKSMVLGGEHRALMQNFHDATKNYADTIRKYGNPSGTAQVSAWHKLAAGALKGGGALVAGSIVGVGPVIGTAIAGLGLRKLSTVLATPEGMRGLMNWNKVANAYKQAPTPGKLARLSAMTRSLDAQQPAR